MSSFRKRNVILNPRGGGPPPASSPAASAPPPPPTGPPPGVRPSPINGQYTTSTGTPSLDNLFAGHAGLPLGCSLLIEEPGTTDYGGALLRYYAAEGIVQGHAVIVIGMGEHWVRELPAVVGDAEAELSSDRSSSSSKEKMKIAWRYERLGEFGSRRPTGGGGGGAEIAATRNTFCHAFDLTKRLTIPSDAKLAFIPPPRGGGGAGGQLFLQIVARLESMLREAPRDRVHRVVIPSLLNPALYPPYAASPQNLLQFFHALRALLRQYSKQLTVMVSLPTELYPRDTGLVRWLEILSDGVLELLPLPRRTAAKAAPGQEEPQGLVKLWKLPVLGEKGGGVGAALGAGEDLAFLVTRRRFEIMAYSLPPADGDQGAKERGTKVDLEF